LDCENRVTLVDFNKFDRMWSFQRDSLPTFHHIAGSSGLVGQGAACECTNSIVGFAIEPACCTLMINDKWFYIREQPVVSRLRLSEPHMQRAVVQSREFEVSWDFENDWEDASWTIKLDEDESDYSFTCFVLQTLRSHFVARGEP
jgi:hypothetical protein